MGDSADARAYKPRVRSRRSSICGIAGYYARGRGPVVAATIRRQCDAILHRGPDSDGVLVDGDFGFGMRRLSIVDLAGSDQPIHSVDRRHSIVFNGEIYNYRPLRDELAALGHLFTTDGDTEVVLAAWRQWGRDAWARLDGMFAVAIWDRSSRRLTLARDAIGIKPLYYAIDGHTLAFGSELKAIQALPEMTFDIDPDAVHGYFTFGHMRGPSTIYRQVRMLEPGATLELGAQGSAEHHQYWTARYTHDDSRTDAGWIDAFRDTWLATIRDQMLSADVEVGAFLSGGVDSSAVVASMARVSDRPVRTFTIGFDDPRYDESRYAEAVAHHLGCRHRTMRLSADDARTVLPAIQRVYDEPFADPSAVPTWYLSRLAAQDVKVALSGDGGDELFFGYKRHLTERRLGRLPAVVRGAARHAARIPPLPWPGANRRLQRWQKTAAGLGLADGVARFFSKTQITTPELRRRLFAGTALDGRDGQAALSDMARSFCPDPDAISTDPLDQFAMCDLQLNLPGAMLTKVDRASMAHSLEVRVPMLSHGMVSLALAMPGRVKLRGGVGKWPVREAVAPWLPANILDRRKQGFQMPLAEWFADDFGGYVEEMWNDGGLRSSGLLNPDAINTLFSEHRTGRRDHARILYAIAIFALWYDRRTS